MAKIDIEAIKKANKYMLVASEKFSEAAATGVSESVQSVILKDLNNAYSQREDDMVRKRFRQKFGCELSMEELEVEQDKCEPSVYMVSYNGVPFMRYDAQVSTAFRMIASGDYEVVVSRRMEFL